MEPTSSRRPRGVAFILHCVAPTLTTIICYVILGALFIGGHVLGLTLKGSTSVLTTFDQNMLEQYAHYVIGPVITFLHNELLNSALTVVLWAVFGLAICVATATLTSRLNEWRESERDISVPTYGVVVHHPLRRTLIIRYLWQTLVAILIALLTALILPLIRFCLDSDIRAIQSGSFISGLYISAITALIWMFIFHSYVILFRLYLLRTRVFGEILN